MIDSALFSKSSVVDLLEEPIAIDASQVKVSKSSLYHLIHAFLKQLHEDESMMKVEKMQAAHEFGFKIGTNTAEEESLGNVKYFVPKPGDKNSMPFVGEMKVLYTKIWPLIFGSASKLFSIKHELSSYKLEDKQFGLTRYLSCSDDERTKSYKKVVFEFSKGVIEGFFDKFQLQADVLFSQVSQNCVNFQLKGVGKKGKSK